MDKYLCENDLSAVDSLNVSENGLEAVTITPLPGWLRGRSKQPRWVRYEQDSLTCQSVWGNCIDCI